MHPRAQAEERRAQQVCQLGLRDPGGRGSGALGAVGHLELKKGLP